MAVGDRQNMSVYCKQTVYVEDFYLAESYSEHRDKNIGMPSVDTLRTRHNSDTRGSRNSSKPKLVCA